MNPLPHGKSAEKVEPPAVDVSSEAVAERAGLLRRDGMAPMSADMLIALAAERVRLVAAIDQRDATIASLREALLRKTPASRQLLNLSEGLRESAEKEVAEQAADLEAARDALEQTLRSLEYWFARGRPHDGVAELKNATPESVIGRARAVLAKLSEGEP
jgi:hypothetical protein